MNAIRIIGLTILATLSLSPMVAASNPHGVLTTRPFSQPVTFAFSQVSPNLACSSFNPNPIFLFNFTENLSGRDPGSTWVQFRFHTQPSELFLFRTSDINQTLYNSYACLTGQGGTPSPVPLWYQVALLTSGINLEPQWRPFQSGPYTVLFVQGTLGGPNAMFPLMATETWTITIIS